MNTVASALSSEATHVVVGDTLPVLTRSITQEMINAYAEATGDFNPIHVDPEYSKTGPFGRTIAHGLMTLAFVAQMLNEWSDGRFDESGEVDIAFVGPVFVGDTVDVAGSVEQIVDRDGVASARVKLSCRAGERQILAGHALQPIENGKS
ncbi:MAG: MaoC family dehydratase [Pseudomonadota bacterium]